MQRLNAINLIKVDAEGVDQLKSTLEALGFAEVRGNVIMTDDNILAWELCAEK